MSSAPAMRMSHASRSTPQRSAISPLRCSTSARRRRSATSGSARSRSIDARSGSPACHAAAAAATSRRALATSTSTLSAAARSSAAAAAACALRRRARSPRARAPRRRGRVRPVRCGSEMPRSLVQAAVVVERVGESAVRGPARARRHASGDRRPHQRMTHLDPRTSHRHEAGRSANPSASALTPADSVARSTGASRPLPSAATSDSTCCVASGSRRTRSRNTRSTFRDSGRPSGSGSTPASCVADSALGSSTSASALPAGLLDQDIAHRRRERRRRRRSRSARPRRRGRARSPRARGSRAPRTPDRRRRAPRTASRSLPRRADEQRT